MAKIREKTDDISKDSVNLREHDDKPEATRPM